MQPPSLTDHLTPAAALDSSLCVWGGTWGGLLGKEVDGLGGPPHKEKGVSMGSQREHKRWGEKWRMKGLRMKMGDGAADLWVG